ncbi:FadR/GntR family transcriptional regulator [Corynebacterium alimapuense]|uniref:GntR family transcriptional regulator n=1 Tax=Corynebacterium alimapuense TaxID=1576874 RepID=A0A3M8KA84_9CORY|nr:FCD domain-containing protein [Corynebacterium alimapuense]RNE49705.1 GntR family transcriptional regulator [Corynebacterium alimapuense]
MPDSSSIKVAPLLTAVLNELGQEIITGTLPEGATFTLNDIGGRFDISRTVAREAMRALEQLGLVASSRRVGITVLPRSSWAVFDQSVINWRLVAEPERHSQLRSLNELRIGVEPQAARSAAQWALPEQRTELVELAEKLRQLGETGQGTSTEFLEADIRFHSLLLLASGNEMFAALTPSLISVLEGRTRYGLQSTWPGPEGLAAHEQLAQAIANGDGESAESQSRQLLTKVNQSLIGHPPREET